MAIAKTNRNGHPRCVFPRMPPGHSDVKAATFEVMNCGLSARQVARSTVAEYLRRARAAGLSWPLPEELDEETLERRLFPALP